MNLAEIVWDQHIETRMKPREKDRFQKKESLRYQFGNTIKEHNIRFEEYRGNYELVDEAIVAQAERYGELLEMLREPVLEPIVGMQSMDEDRVSFDEYTERFRQDFPETKTPRLVAIVARFETPTQDRGVGFARIAAAKYSVELAYTFAAAAEKNISTDADPSPELLLERSDIYLKQARTFLDAARFVIWDTRILALLHETFADYHQVRNDPLTQRDRDRTLAKLYAPYHYRRDSVQGEGVITQLVKLSGPVIRGLDQALDITGGDVDRFVLTPAQLKQDRGIGVKFRFIDLGGRAMVDETLSARIESEQEEEIGKTTFPLEDVITSDDEEAGTAKIMMKLQCPLVGQKCRLVVYSKKFAHSKSLPFLVKEFNVAYRHEDEKNAWPNQEDQTIMLQSLVGPNFDGIKIMKIFGEGLSGAFPIVVEP